MSRFYDLANFENTKFFGISDFGGATINITNVKLVSFKGDSSFSTAKFLQQAMFSQSHFMGVVDFSKAEFKESPDFKDTLYFGQPYKPAK